MKVLSLLLVAFSGAASAFREHHSYREADVCSPDSESYSNEFYGRDVYANGVYERDLDYGDYYARSPKSLFDNRDLDELEHWSRDPGLYQSEFAQRVGRGVEDVEYALGGRRSPEFKTVAYKVLEQAAGSRGLQRGQQYAILEDDGFGGRHRIVVGVVSDSMNRGARFLDWSQTNYHNVLFDELDSRSCRPLGGVWNPFRASSHHHGFLGMVRPGANLQRIGEEYLMRAGKRFNVRNWRL